MFKKSRGFTLVEVIIAAAILGISIYQFATIATSAYKAQKQVDVSMQAVTTRLQVLKALDSESIWRKTVEATASMECLKKTATTDCNIAPTGEVFQIHDENGPLAISGPFTYNFVWFAVCPPAPESCSNPTVRITGDMSVKPGESIGTAIINLEKYKIDFFRGEMESSKENLCIAMDGIYDTATGNCSSKYAGKTCPNPRQVVTGLNADGTLQCEYLFKGKCPDGEVVSGFDAQGFVLCNPKNCAKCVTPPVTYCDFSLGRMVTKDCSGKITNIGAPCVPVCGLPNRSNCEGPDYVTRNSCNVIIGTIPLDPRCSYKPPANCVPGPENYFCQCPPCWYPGPRCAANCGNVCCLFWCERHTSSPGWYLPSYDPYVTGPAGWICPKQCDPGSFSAFQNVSNCTPCPVDTFAAAPAATYCQPVANGQFAPMGSSAAFNCTNKVGNSVYTSSGGGLNACEFTCSPGSGGAGCTSCAGGTFSVGGPPPTPCQPVNIGQYAPPGSASPVSCSNKPANSYYTGPGGGADNCPWDCNPGYVNNGSSCDLPPTPPPGS